MHKSIELSSPIEFVNVTSISPFISKCQIKVCYVGDEPNRNRSIITKDVAKELANTLRGSPIVGFFNEEESDFEEHNRGIKINDGEFEIVETTKPYGFVDLNAKVWFKKFLDDDKNEHEYLMTEGYLWTGQYPECQRVIDKGNNESMELDDKKIKGTWTKDNNGKPKFFIINEAIIKNLCILGEKYEPCFEGSNITSPKITFSFDDGFKEQLFSMMKELKEFMNEGGTNVFTTYAVEIGDKLWDAIYSHIYSTYPDPDCNYCSIYRVEGVFEEGEQKFAILQHHSDMKYYRLNFSITEDAGFVPEGELTEVTKTYIPAAEPQFAAEKVEEYENNFKCQGKKDKYDKDKNDNKTEEPKNKKDDEKSENEDDNSKEDKSSDDEDEDEEKKKSKFGKDGSEDDTSNAHSEYSLDDVTEYQELKAQYEELSKNYEELQEKYSLLETSNSSLTEENSSLKEFKLGVEKQEKQKMIDSFYMLSDEDKADVISNIDSYSIDDIESKLSVICVRNKVSFNLDNDNNGTNGPTVFNLEGNSDDDTPDWVKAVIDTEKTLN